jgi:hypothetical protein
VCTLGFVVKGTPNSDIYDCCRNSISDFTTLGRLKQTLKFLWKSRLDLKVYTYTICIEVFLPNSTWISEFFQDQSTKRKFSETQIRLQVYTVTQAEKNMQQYRQSCPLFKAGRDRHTLSTSRGQAGKGFAEISCGERSDPYEQNLKITQ